MLFISVLCFLEVGRFFIVEKIDSLLCTYKIVYAMNW